MLTLVVFDDFYLDEFWDYCDVGDCGGRDYWIGKEVVEVDCGELFEYDCDLEDWKWEE